MKRSCFIFVVLLLVVAGLSSSGFAQKNGKELREAVDRVDKSADVVAAIMKAEDKSIPKDLLNRAKAIVVFPGTLKAAFIVGGQGGHGVAVRRVGTGWS